MTNVTSATRPARRRPGADQSRRQQHRPADDRHVRPGHRRQVRQARRTELRGRCRADSAEVSPRTRAGASPPDRRARPAPRRRTIRTRCPARWIGAASPSVGSPVADRTATVRSRRSAWDPRLERAGWPAVSSAKPATDAKTTTRPDISSASTACSDPRNINLPLPSDRGVSLGATMTAAALP